MAVGACVTGSAVRNDGGVIVTPQANSFGSTRWEEASEVFGVGLGVPTTPKTGLATIDVISAVAGATYLGNSGVLASKVTTALAGVSNSVLQKMDKGIHLQSPKRDDASGVATATAVRNNQWSTQSGTFTTPPATFNSAWGTDFSSVPTGGINSTYGNKIRFMAGGADPSGTTYKGKTVW